MRRIFWFMILSGFCIAGRAEPPVSEPVVFAAERADVPIVVDGRLDDSVWLDAVAYPLVLPADVASDKAAPAESGTVRLAWDDTYFYIAFEFTDSDVVERGDADQLQQQKTGDVGELFLHPENETWYWEFHVTPRGHKSSFFFPGKGYWGLSGGFDYECGMVAAATIDGTLNAWQDYDQGWTAEIAIPVADLIAHGESFKPGSEWRILCGRYNYSRYLPSRELSAAPALPRTHFHNQSYYARLQLSPESVPEETK